MRKISKWLPVLAVLTVVGWPGRAALAGEIALTFDDAPTPDSSALSGVQRTQRLIQQLKGAAVEDVWFFVTTSHINQQSRDRLHQYTKAGFHLGNHSHSHLSADKTPKEEFLLDTSQAQTELKAFQNLVPFYRYPYLHQGSTKEIRADIKKGLLDLGYGHGYVTVDNFDWYLNSLYLKAVESGKKVDHKQLSKLYVDVLWSSIVFYDDLAKRVLGRSPKHVLLLHENDLAALHVGDLIKHIRGKGWKIISPEAAYADAVAEAEEGLEFNKQGLVAALAHKAGVVEKDLRHVTEDTQHLDALFKEYQIIVD